MVASNAKYPMPAHIRLPVAQTPASSPPPSPRLSPRLRYGRSKSGRVRGLEPPPLPCLQRFGRFLLSVLLRRHGVFLLVPLIYISGMLLYMGSVSPVVPAALQSFPPGSIYRSPEVFKHLWPAMQTTNESFGVLAAWQPFNGVYWKPCISPQQTLRGLQKSSGFIVVEANGGLNQQRSSICDAVALAGLLNATLVIPRFHYNSVWQDPSSFGDIFDEETFINTLSEDVKVVRQLPDYMMERIGNNISNIFKVRVKAWAPATFYLQMVLPKLLETGAIRISPFANRLSFDKVPPQIQQLRCLANFEALRFAPPIAAVGKILVDRMIQHSAGSDGKYLAVHLRFEEDMVAFSCCVYDGGEEEKREMDAARERSWTGKFNRTGRVINPGANRMDGKCPLTPLEVGMMLRGMGFQNTTPIYLAAGKIYKAEKNMAPLQQMFPFLRTKDMLLSVEEISPLQMGKLQKTNAGYAAE
eukprot:c22267_g1_i1 orf=176-1585(+)